jgi:hypothetical protein
MVNKTTLEKLTRTHPQLVDLLERVNLQANRYRWLRREFLAGRQRDIAEGLNNKKELDDYIDHKISEEFGGVVH